MTDASARHLPGRLSTLSLGLTLAAALLAARPAHAQKAPSQAAAQALFEEGRKLMAAGKYGEACPKLAESQRLDPGAGTLLNLAACYEKNGQTASAWATYKEAVAESEKSNRPEWAQRSRQHATQLEPQLARMVIQVPEAVRAPGLLIKRDGVEVGSGEWGVPIPVDPGAHAIEASATSKKAWRTTVQVEKKASASVTVPALEAAPEPKPTTADKPAPDTTKQPDTTKPLPAPADPSVGGTQRTVGLVLVGAGVVGVGVGVVFGLGAMGKRDDAKTDCTPDFAFCNQKGLDAVDAAKSKATISTIATIAGGALAAGGLALYVLAPRNREAAAVRVNIGASSIALGGSF